MKWRLLQHHFEITRMDLNSRVTLDQVESYFLAKGIETDAKQVACLHLSLREKLKLESFSKTSERDTFVHERATLIERFQ